MKNNTQSLITMLCKFHLKNIQNQIIIVKIVVERNQLIKIY